MRIISVLLTLLLIVMQKTVDNEGRVDCPFCGDNSGGLSIMMGEALQAKHAISQSEGYLGYIDVIMKL